MDNKAFKILNISSDGKKTVESIDKSKFLNLDNKRCTRMELFTFALALGVESNTKTDLAKVETFVRSEYISTRYEAYLYAVYVYYLKSKDNFDEIDDIKKVYDEVQKYANTGFQILEDLHKKPEEITRLELMNDIDKAYEKYKNDF